MAVKIRLARSGGRKKLPFYSIVATDSRMPRDGRFLEKLGFYNPTLTSGMPKLSLEKDAIAKWLEKGAEPTETLQKIFIKEGLGSKKQVAKWTRILEQKTVVAKAKKEAEEAAKAAEAAKQAAEAEESAE
jgi:small subunit ribosomal protein S16